MLGSQDSLQQGKDVNISVLQKDDLGSGVLILKAGLRQGLQQEEGCAGSSLGPELGQWSLAVGE